MVAHPSTSRPSLGLFILQYNLFHVNLFSQHVIITALTVLTQKAKSTLSSKKSLAIIITRLHFVMKFSLNLNKQFLLVFHDQIKS